MEKEVKIIPPEGYEIDKENSSLERIVFKKKDTKPRSWEEYCLNVKRNSVFWISGDSNVENVYSPDNSATLIPSFDKNTLPSKELAEAFLAMMQLMSLRQAWIGDWEPDWNNEYLNKYCIIGTHYDFEVCLLNKCRYPLSFPTKEMAEDFMNTFKDLLEIAKPLI